MEKIAAQLYTVRDFTKTAKDFAQTCKRIRKMGYEGVQLSAVPLAINPTVWEKLAAITSW